MWSQGFGTSLKSAKAWHPLSVWRLLDGLVSLKPHRQFMCLSSSFRAVRQSHAPAGPVSVSACLSLSQLMNIRVCCVWKRIHPFQAIPPVSQRWNLYLALTGLSSKLSVSEGLLAQSSPVCERWKKTDLSLWPLNQSLQKQMVSNKMCFLWLLIVWNRAAKQS